MLDDLFNVLVGVLPWQVQAAILVAVIGLIGLVWFLVS